MFLFFRFTLAKNGFTLERLECSKIEAMTAATNLGSNRRMVKALSQYERLTESNLAFGTLALSTARALDEALSNSERRYVVDQLSRAHLAALRALERIPGPDGPDAFAELPEELTKPTPGTPAPTSDRF